MPGGGPGSRWRPAGRTTWRPVLLSAHTGPGRERLGGMWVARPVGRSCPWQARGCVHPFGGARGWWPRGHGAVRVRAAGSIRQAAGPPVAGASKTSDHALPASGPAHAAFRAAGGQGADLAVAHRVEDPGEQLARGGDLGDVLGLLAAAGEDVVFAPAQRVAGGHVLDRLHQRPPHERGSLLGDVPAADLDIGLPVPGGQPGPRAQPGWVREPGNVADLGHQHRREYRADARQGRMAW